MRARREGRWHTCRRAPSPRQTGRSGGRRHSTPPLSSARWLPAARRRLQSAQRGPTCGTARARRAQEWWSGSAGRKGTARPACTAGAAGALAQNALGHGIFDALDHRAAPGTKGKGCGQVGRGWRRPPRLPPHCPSCAHQAVCSDSRSSSPLGLIEWNSTASPLRGFTASTCAGVHGRGCTESCVSHKKNKAGAAAAGRQRQQEPPAPSAPCERIRRTRGRCRLRARRYWGSLREAGKEGG